MHLIPLYYYVIQQHLGTWKDESELALVVSVSSYDVVFTAELEKRSQSLLPVLLSENTWPSNINV